MCKVLFCGLHKHGGAIVFTHILKFFPVFTFEKLVVILKLHTKENTPVEVMSLCHTKRAIIVFMFLAWYAWFSLFAK
jgi:hypothetical protein